MAEIRCLPQRDSFPTDPVAADQSRLSLLSGASHSTHSVRSNDDVPVIRRADVENHNRDGGLWVVIAGRVYDVHDFKSVGWTVE